MLTGNFHVRAAVAAALCIGSANSALAGEKVDLGAGAWLSIGGEMRAAYRATDDAFLESTRLNLNAQASKVVGFTLNTELEHDRNGDPDGVHILDAIVRLEFSELFNVWGGRMLPPNDRANLDGPYFLGIWDYPIVSAFPAEFAGRDDGVAVWGQTGGGRFKYQVGAFKGCNGDNVCNTGAADDGDLSYTGRLTYNFWDPEPGYYTSSDYYGKKEILAVAVSATYQSDATGSAGDSGDYFGWTVDALMQKTVWGGHVLTLEGAYYHYDTDDKLSPLVNGNGYFVLVSFLIDRQIGIGRLQPVVRYEELAPEGGFDVSRVQGGVNYIIREHDARISLLASRTDSAEVGVEATDQVIAGVQLRY
jgi:hypothetical protein